MRDTQEHASAHEHQADEGFIPIHPICGSLTNWEAISAAESVCAPRMTTPTRASASGPAPHSPSS